MRTCLAFIAVLLTTLPVTAQTAFFNRTTRLPVPGVNLPLPATIFASDFNHDGFADLAVGGDGAVVILLGQASGEFLQSQSFPVQGQAAAIVAADFNQDGNPDLAIALPDMGAISILPGAADGSFRQPVTSALAPVNSRMISMATGDFDGDGKPDLAVCYLSGEVAVLIGTGANGFRAGVMLHSAQPIVQNAQILVADLNNDGHPDLMVGRSRVSSIGVYFGKGDGTFSAELAFEVCRDPAALAAADIDGDGILDLIVGSSSVGGVWLLRGNGDGGFRTPVALAWTQGAGGLASADWNGDGIPDIAASLPNGMLSIVYGKGGAAFSDPKDYPVGPGPSSIAICDFDGDGNPDIAVLSSFSQSISTLLNRTGGDFSPGVTIARFRPTSLVSIPGDTAGFALLNSAADEALVFGLASDGGVAYFTRLHTGRQPSRLVVTDFNQDGVADLAVGNGGSGDISLFRGRPEGGYEAERRLTLGRVPIGLLAAADINVDGKPDLIVALPTPSSGLAILLANDDGFDLPRLVIREPFPTPFAAADFTGDGVIDLAVADLNAGLLLLRGNGDGTFEPVIVENRLGLTFLSVADLNSDGKPDLVAIEGGRSVVLYLNSSEGLHASPPWRFGGEAASTLAAADFNGDGKADVALPLGNPDGVLIAFGAGDGSFQQGGLYPVAGANSGLAIAVLDVNRDGRPDLVAATSEGIVILWNDPAPPPPPVPSVPRPISPVNNAFISQNDPASSCPADPLLGSGYRIRFAWMPSEPFANVRGYELFATLRGAPQPIVNTVVPSVPFFETSKCGYVPDVGLDGWEWRVRALGISSADSDWSETATFRFLPCRFPDSRPCGTPPLPPPGGGSVPSGNLSVERAQHTATLLADGRVLLAGGDNYNSGRVLELASAELYDPKTGQFTFTGPLRTARAQHRATLLADGRVLLTGGVAFPLPPPAQPVSLASAEVYAPSTGQFTPVGNLAQPRVGHAAVRLADGRVLITGGTIFPAGSGFATAEIFSPATNSFTPAGSLTFSRYFHTTTLLPSGQALVAGGVGPLNMLAELYDPARGVFTTTQPPVFPQFAHTATLLAGSQVLLAGGWSVAGPTASMQIFDSATGRFQFVGALTAPRQLHEATLLSDGSVLFTGGASTNGVRLPIVERFTPATRLVAPLPPMLAPRADHTATLLPDGRVLIVGGTSGSDQGISWTRSAETYSPTAQPGPPR